LQDAALSIPQRVGFGTHRDFQCWLPTSERLARDSVSEADDLGERGLVALLDALLNGVGSGGGFEFLGHGIVSLSVVDQSKLERVAIVAGLWLLLALGAGELDPITLFFRFGRFGLLLRERHPLLDQHDAIIILQFFFGADGPTLFIELGISDGGALPRLLKQ